MMAATLSLSQLNRLDRAQFTQVLGGVFEHSAWVAAQAFAAAPFGSIDELHAAMCAVVDAAATAQQLALLRAHPELAGRRAQAGELSAASTQEQRGVGLNALSESAQARITQLNAAYRARFGFPFVIAVGNHTQSSLFAEWQRRLGNDRPTELAAGLAQVAMIARLRLEKIFCKSG